MHAELAISHGAFSGKKLSVSDWPSITFSQTLQLPIQDRSLLSGQNIGFLLVKNGPFLRKRHIQSASHQAKLFLLSLQRFLKWTNRTIYNILRLRWSLDILILYSQGKQPLNNDLVSLKTRRLDRDKDFWSQKRSQKGQFQNDED